MTTTTTMIAATTTIATTTPAIALADKPDWLDEAAPIQTTFTQSNPQNGEADVLRISGVAYRELYLGLLQAIIRSNSGEFGAPGNIFKQWNSECLKRLIETHLFDKSYRFALPIRSTWQSRSPKFIDVLFSTESAGVWSSNDRVLIE